MIFINLEETYETAVVLITVIRKQAQKPSVPLKKTKETFGSRKQVH